MADPVFDIESFSRLDRASQEATADAVGAMKTAAEAGMLLGDANFDQYAAMNDYAGKAGKALVGLDIGTSLAEGRPAEAVETAGEWLAGEALSNGFSDVLKETTHSPDFGRGMGLPDGYRDAFADAVGGAMGEAAQVAADSAVEAGQWLKDRATDVIRVDPRTQFGRTALDYQDFKDVRDASGLDEYNHFEELPHQYGDPEVNAGTLARGAERPDSYGLGHDIGVAAEKAANVIAFDPPAADYGVSATPPFVTRAPAVDELSDFVTVEGDSVRPGAAEALRFDLGTADRLGTTLRADVADHASAYTYDAEYEDRRDFGTTERAVGLHDDIRDTAAGADEAVVELRQLGREFESEQDLEQYIEDGLSAHRFDGGELRAGGPDAAVHHTGDGTHVPSAAGGAVLVGRDDGYHVGGRGDDLSLDAGTAHLGPGDDVVLLDNETGRHADGGVGRDTLVGGRGNEVLVGGAGADHLRAGAGDDTLYGGTVDDAGRGVDDHAPDRLAPGAGVDTVHAGHGDVVEAASEGGSRADTLHLGGLELRGPVDARGRPAGLDGEGRGTGAAGELYRLDRDTGELRVEHEGRSVSVQGFREGDFGIGAPAREKASLSTSGVATSNAAAPDTREILQGDAYGWARIDHSASLVGEGGAVAGVHLPDRLEARAGLGGVMDRVAGVFRADPPGLSLPELFERASEVGREVAARDTAELGGTYRSPEGWRLAHPETHARADAVRDAYANGLLRGTRVEVELDAPNGTPLPARAQAAAISDALDRVAAAQAQAFHDAEPYNPLRGGPDFPRALRSERFDFERARPVPGSEAALRAQGDPHALEREAAQETARETAQAAREAAQATREAVGAEARPSTPERDRGADDDYGVGL